LNLRIVFMGSPEYAVFPLQQLISNGHEILAVYTRRDKPGGRGRLPLTTPIKTFALSCNLPVIEVATLKSQESIERLSHIKPDTIVVAAFGQILPPPVLEIPCFGCINIHPSLLPRYRGASPVAAAILAGDDFAGVSVMRMDAGLDSGPVFSRAQIPVLPQDTTGSLTTKLFRTGARVLLEVLAVLPRGKFLPEPQNPDQASYSAEIIKEEGKIDWTLTANDIWRRVRAYQPWPEAYTRWKGKQLKIIETIPLPAEEPVPQIGQVMVPPSSQNRPKAAFGVGTGQGILGVIKVQLEGKRVMTADEFVRGQRDFIGSVLS
jgi:methionyl-tRNA formyltransferase